MSVYDYPSKRFEWYCEEQREKTVSEKNTELNCLYRDFAAIHKRMRESPLAYEDDGPERLRLLAEIEILSNHHIVKHLSMYPIRFGSGRDQDEAVLNSLMSPANDLIYQLKKKGVK
ncbi:hypothetical protein [Planctopirus hydrillae]|uniref:Uncharacterized protein n=1 Tax=Planctopirus hydrillae TaxID=1841610 RepID=A0A1C3EU18_9PLAN|nr:hypothetical protein [Planctopirus hydrillae]ODA36728.1 hypothetical protein A6X21_15405 [Planctopirus hydrillae]